MTRPFRTFLALSLTLALVISGFGMASARGMAPAAGQMELCTGVGALMIYVDEDGRPTAPPHLCPDCVLHFGGAIHAEGDVVDERMPVLQQRPGRHVTVTPLHKMQAAWARGPPRVV